MILVLLPRLDGTGLLFKPFLASLPLKVRTKVIAYPADKALKYDALLSYVRDRLPLEDFILIAESFSGPIAYSLALERPKYLRSIIFAASFLSAPRPKLQKLIHNLPLFSLPIPKLLVEHVLLGKGVEQSMVYLFKQTVKSVPAEVLGYRLKQITALELDGRINDLPCSYIQATEDKLVLAESLVECEQRIEKLKVLRVKGPILYCKHKHKNVQILLSVK